MVKGRLAVASHLCYHSYSGPWHSFCKENAIRVLLGLAELVLLSTKIDYRPFYLNGFNAYWLMQLASNPNERAKVTSTLQQASWHGTNVARTWAFSDGGSNPLQISPGFYDENMFKVLILNSLRTNWPWFFFSCRHLLTVTIWCRAWISSYLRPGEIECIWYLAW